MPANNCKDPRWRWVFLVLFLGVVFVAALFLYFRGWLFGAGFAYSLAVLVLFCFALAGAIAVALLIYALFRRWCELRGAPPKGQGTREKSGQTSARLPSTIYKRPDPLIYSQYFLLSRGFAVTWDNPDIWLTELPAPDGSMAPVASHQLLPNHVYRVHAQIYNGSTDAPAVGMPVFFSFLTFGIGIVPTLIGVAIVDLPVKGASGHPRQTFQDWRTPATAGHYCLQVLLFWGDDAQPDNNLGQENVDVGKLSSPATFKFPVRNDSLFSRSFRLEVDTYPPPVAPPCPVPPATDPTRSSRMLLLGADDRLARLAKHRRDAHPLPAGWTVQFSPGAEFDLGAGEQVEIIATVNAPAAVPIPQLINVNAFADGLLAGGITLYVQS